MELCLIR